jgi:hypothetical protein
MTAAPSGAAAALTVVERGRRLTFTFADLLRHHGPGSPGGVAHAYKVLERALPLLSPEMPPERRELTVATAFGGPGARDGIELVTRAVTDGRFKVDPALRRPGLGVARERFVFLIGLRGRTVELVLREGFVTEEFAALAFAGERDAQQEARLEILKGELADRLMGAPAEEVYDAVLLDGSSW